MRWEEYGCGQEHRAVSPYRIDQPIMGLSPLLDMISELAVLGSSCPWILSKGGFIVVIIVILFLFLFVVRRVVLSILRVLVQVGWS